MGSQTEFPYALNEDQVCLDSIGGHVCQQIHMLRCTLDGASGNNPIPLSPHNVTDLISTYTGLPLRDNSRSNRCEPTFGSRRTNVTSGIQRDRSVKDNNSLARAVLIHAMPDGASTNSKANLICALVVADETKHANLDQAIRSYDLCLRSEP